MVSQCAAKCQIKNRIVTLSAGKQYRPFIKFHYFCTNGDPKNPLWRKIYTYIYIDIGALISEVGHYT